MTSQTAGWLATIIFSFSFLPQIFKTYRLKKVNDVSVWPWIVQTVGYLFALSFGIGLREPVLIVGYSWGFLCSVLYLFLYFSYRTGK